MSEDTVHQRAARKVANATQEAATILLAEGLERIGHDATPDDVADCVNEAVFFMGWWEKAEGTLRAYSDAAEQERED